MIHTIQWVEEGSGNTILYRVLSKHFQKPQVISSLHFPSRYIIIFVIYQDVRCKSIPTMFCLIARGRVLLQTTKADFVKNLSFKNKIVFYHYYYLLSLEFFFSSIYNNASLWDLWLYFFLIFSTSVLQLFYDHLKCKVS